MIEWSLRVESSGGITGRGDGSISIDSSGLVEKVTPHGTVCRETIGGDLLGALHTAVARARPKSWDDQYLHEGGADFFSYTLSMEIDGTDQPVVEWNDGVALPVDLRELRDAIGTVQRNVDCQSDSRPSGPSS